MRLLVGFCCLVLLGHYAKAQSSYGSEKYLVNMSGPPFWMSAYEEFKNLRKDQKDFYLKNLKEDYKKIPDLGKVTDKQWDMAIEDKETWDGLRRNLYVACQNPGFNKVCLRMADARVDAINMYQNQSERNLKALQKKK